MGRILLFILLFGTATSLLAAPWITGLAYVANSLIQPQYIWPWIFEGIQIFRITAGLAILGFLFSLAQKKIDLSIYKEKQSIYVLILWGWMHLSHKFTSYPGSAASVSPELVLNTLNSIIIMYFILLPLCKSEVALKYLCYVFVAAGLYYTYWANSAYLNQEWWRFANGRLTGPIGSPYRDANVLSALIVMCMPFLILLIYRVKGTLSKIMIIGAIPLLWHALILFSSRGALLATAVTLVALSFVIKSKKFNITIGAAFIIFLAYQGSILLNRTTETIETARVESNQPVNPRLVSWSAGLKLIPIYPVFGAGVQKYEAATRNHFPGMTPHVAHNTFLNFSANTGLLTGIIFLGLVIAPIFRLKKVLKKGVLDLNNLNTYALASSTLGMVGFFICSLFLDLIIYEPFYIMTIINLIAYKNKINGEAASKRIRKTKHNKRSKNMREQYGAISNNQKSIC
ncbi:MAG: O-antigen ligase family protein [Saccharospirillum sp.]